MIRTPLCALALVACVPVAQAGTSPEPSLTLIVDTALKTFTFEGSLTAQAQPFGSNFAVRWEFTPPGGPDTSGPFFGTEGLGSMLSIGEENPAALLGALDLQFFPNGAAPDLMRLDARWSGDPGLVTFTATGNTQSYADLNADARAIFERSIGSVLPGSSTSPDAPGIPIIGIPAPGALACFAMTALGAARRRR
ncbi:MAG: hypothetical protein Tsb0013_16620 [Phycisphaerales bacterium]